ncbi:MAG: hypothetical protein JXA33_23380 [Anaerolineae bacterium]|nr:hypothetical protein [Anaerolineae bacterium]
MTEEHSHKASRIVIAADSLALPRPLESGLIKYEQTYGYLLHTHFMNQKGQQFKEVIIHGQRSNTIKYLDTTQHLYDEVLAWEPHIVILHLGIVDCAPRIFSAFERKLVNRIRPTSWRDLFIRFVSKHRRFILTHLPQKVYVPLNEFKERYKHVRDVLLSHNISVLMVNISPTDTETAFRSPGLVENIHQYNTIIEECAKASNCYLVNIYEALRLQDPAEYSIDGIHLTQIGHRILADLLIETLPQIIPSLPDGVL